MGTKKVRGELVAVLQEDLDVDGRRRYVLVSCASCKEVAYELGVEPVGIEGSSELSVGRGVEPSGDEEHSEAVVL
ncbi:hypothetical protein, partial [Brachybacterium paraconglomeratum]|uniref:hypothetical protein n=1 Tax=Brachybacterium paraconglomeratum TaxID=173362 RepID=UPI0022AEEDDA